MKYNQIWSILNRSCKQSCQQNLIKYKIKVHIIKIECDRSEISVDISTTLKPIRSWHAKHVENIHGYKY